MSEPKLAFVTQTCGTGFGKNCGNLKYMLAPRAIEPHRKTNQPTFKKLLFNVRAEDLIFGSAVERREEGESESLFLTSLSNFAKDVFSYTKTG